MQLRDEGWFALDDLLYRHLPGTPVGGVTLRQLLGHVAGLQREPDGAVVGARPPARDVDELPRRADVRQARPPAVPHATTTPTWRTGCSARCSQRVTGEAWPTLLRKRLLDPLGMKRTTYQPVEPFARGYVVHPWHGTLREEPRLDAGRDGAGRAALVDGRRPGEVGGVPGRPDAGRAQPASTLDEMCAPVVISDLESWTAGHGLGPAAVARRRAGVRRARRLDARLPGHLAVHRPVAHRRGRLRQRVHAARATASARSAGGSSTAVLDAEPVRAAAVAAGRRAAGRGRARCAAAGGGWAASTTRRGSRTPASW